MLDDIFDKLDDDRIHRLMQLVADGAFRQIFITDARPERTREMLKRSGVDAQMMEVKGNEVKEI